MSRPMRHLPMLVLTAIMLTGVVSCGNDEPRGRQHGSEPIPADSTHRNDTTPGDSTAHHPTDTIPTDTVPADTTHHQGDTTSAFTIILNAPRPYGYKGQTLQLTAVTSSPATVSWRSTRTAAAWIDSNGLVTFSNTVADDSTIVIATALGSSDSIKLTNRCWNVAAWSGTTWVTPAYFTAHAGDTIALTIVDSNSQPINDQGFNAAACQWIFFPDGVAMTAATPGQSNGWQYRLAIKDDTPVGTIITIMAQHGDAASTLACAVVR